VAISFYVLTWIDKKLHCVRYFVSPPNPVTSQFKNFFVSKTILKLLTIFSFDAGMDKAIGTDAKKNTLHSDYN
jgi:hypothetical protein